MDDFVENEGAKLFQDSVHGTMQFEKLIVKVIDTIEFQRLRNIKQLSTAYLVYPAAAHNRFEHCLGVCFLAGTLLDHLQRNSSLTWCKLLPDKEESRKLKLAVKVAALLHDIGHGPFSHTWEHFVSSSKKQFKHEISSEAILDSMIWKSTDNLTDANLTTLGKHFKEEFEDVLKYVKFIKHVISGNPIIPNKERSFLYQVVACKKNDVDVDKFDYFLRDAQHLNFGVPFDHKRLMMLSRIEIDSDGESHIAFRDVEEYSIELMFRVRADLHIRAYQHRVVKCLETMVIDALKEAEKAGYKVGGYALSDVHLDTRQFLKLTDSILECILNTEGKCYEAARKILTRVATRDLYTTIGEWTLDVKQSEEEKRDNVPPKGLSSTKLLELEDWLEQKCAVSQVAVNKGMYFNPMINVRFYSKDGEENVGGTRSKRTLTCLMELPYYKIYVFSRGNKESEFKEKRRKVEEFLVKEGVFITDK